MRANDAPADRTVETQFLASHLDRGWNIGFHHGTFVVRRVAP
jgi:hypothetical protein